MSSFPEHTVVRMPSLSPTMEAGNLVEWLVAEGDEFAAGDELASIQTDKAEVSLEATDDGFLAKILVQGGTDDIPISTPIAVTVDEEDLLAAFKDFTVDDAPAGKSAAAPPASEPAQAAAPAPAPTPAPAPAAAPKPAPAAAPAPAPAPAPAAAVPAPAPPTASTELAAGTSSGYVAFERWGRSLSRSAAGGSLINDQAAYVAEYGSTGMEDPSIGEDESA